MAIQVGLIAVNDSIVIEATMYRIFKIFFGDKAYYTKLLDLFHEVSLSILIGEWFGL